MFGRLVVVWLWLEQGITASQALQADPGTADRNFYRGKLQAMRYFFRYELINIDTWADLLCSLDDTCLNMQTDWF